MIILIFIYFQQKCEYLGFIYDESIGIEVKQSSLLSPNKHFSQPPLITLFQIRNKFQLVFVNIHCKSDKDQAKGLSNLLKTLGKIERRIFIDD